MKRVASAVWQFFDKIEENKRCVSVVCKLCDVETKFFGNTTNLRTHLTKKHPIQWELREEVQKSKAESDVSVVNDDDLSSIPLKRRSVRAQEDNVQYGSVYSEDNDEDSKAADILVEQLHAYGSDEEWLEEEILDENSRTVVKSEHKSPLRTKSVYIKGKPRKRTTDALIESPSQQTHDEYSVFGEYVASKLRKIKSPRTRGNIQQIITTVLWQADYGLYDSSESVRKVIMSNIESPKPSTSDPEQPSCKATSTSVVQNNAPSDTPQQVEVRLIRNVAESALT